MKKNKIFIYSSLILLFIIGIFLLLDVSLAAYGVDETAGAAGIKGEYSGDIKVLIGNLIGAVLSMVGVVFFGLMIYGGFLWMTARGNQETEKNALSTIMGAVIGIIIVIAAYAITNFVFKNVKNGGGGNTLSNASVLFDTEMTTTLAAISNCIDNKKSDCQCPTETKANGCIDVTCLSTLADEARNCTVSDE